MSDQTADKKAGASASGESALKIHHLRPAPGAKTAKTRVGRGEGSKGKTAGRGTKGTKARYQVPERFEGGSMPLHMRIPKLRGFKNPFRTEYQVVNLDRLEHLFPEGGEVSVDDLVAKGAVRDGFPVKVLGTVPPVLHGTAPLTHTEPSVAENPMSEKSRNTLDSERVEMPGARARNSIFASTSLPDRPVKVPLIESTSLTSCPREYRYFIPRNPRCSIRCAKSRSWWGCPTRNICGWCSIAGNSPPLRARACLPMAIRQRT